MANPARKLLCAAVTATLALGMMTSAAFAVESQSPQNPTAAKVQSAASLSDAAATAQHVRSSATKLTLNSTKTAYTSWKSPAYQKFTATSKGIYKISVTTAYKWYSNLELCYNGVFNTFVDSSKEFGYGTWSNGYKTLTRYCKLEAGQTVYIRASQDKYSTKKATKTLVKKTSISLGDMNYMLCNKMPKPGDIPATEDFTIENGDYMKVVPGEDYELVGLYIPGYDENFVGQPLPEPCDELYTIDVVLQGKGFFTGTISETFEYGDGIDWLVPEKNLYVGNAYNMDALASQITLKSMLREGDIKASDLHLIAYSDDDDNVYYVSEYGMPEPGKYTLWYAENENDTIEWNDGPIYNVNALLIDHDLTSSDFRVGFDWDDEPNFFDDKFHVGEPFLYFAYTDENGVSYSMWEMEDEFGDLYTLDAEIVGWKPILDYVWDEETCNDYPVYGDMVAEPSPISNHDYAVVVQEKGNAGHIWEEDLYIENGYSAGVVNISDKYSKFTCNTKMVISETALQTIDPILTYKKTSTTKVKLTNGEVTPYIVVNTYNEETEVTNTEYFDAQQVRSNGGIQQYILSAAYDPDMYVEIMFVGNPEKNYGSKWAQQLEVYPAGDINLWTFDGDKSSKTGKLFHNNALMKLSYTYNGSAKAPTFALWNPATGKKYTQASPEVHVDVTWNNYDTGAMPVDKIIHAGMYAAEISIDGFNGTITRLIWVAPAKQSTKMTFSTSKTVASTSKTVKYNANEDTVIPLYAKNYKAEPGPEFWLSKVTAATTSGKPYVDYFDVQEDGNIIVSAGCKKGTYYVYVTMYANGCYDGNWDYLGKEIKKKITVKVS